MGQNWWWVVLVVAVIVVLAVLLVWWRVQRGADAGTPPPSDVEIAAASAGGAGGAVGAAGVAASRGKVATERERPPADTAATDDTAAEPDDPGALPPEPRDGASDTARVAPARRVPEPADSALAALDSGLVGSRATHGASADAVTAIGTRPGPHPGSAHPMADGSPPSPDYPIKANGGSRRYHTPDSPYFVRTRADLWFRTPQEAHAAGFTAWDAGRAAQGPRSAR